MKFFIFLCPLQLLIDKCCMNIPSSAIKTARPHWIFICALYVTIIFDSSYDIILNIISFDTTRPGISKNRKIIYVYTNTY